MEKQNEIERLKDKIIEMKSDKNTPLELLLIKNWNRSIKILNNE